MSEQKKKFQYGLKYKRDGKWFRESFNTYRLDKLLEHVEERDIEFRILRREVSEWEEITFSEIKQSYTPHYVRHKQMDKK